MWREERIIMFIIIIHWNSWWWRGYDNFWKLQVVHALPPSYSFRGESVVWNFCPIISCMLTYLSVSAYSFLFVSFIMKGDGCLLCIEEPCPHNPWSLKSYFFFFFNASDSINPLLRHRTERCNLTTNVLYPLLDPNLQVIRVSLLPFQRHHAAIFLGTML